VAAAIGDRFVLRRPSPGRVVAGGVVLDPVPPTGVARRRMLPDRLEQLAAAALAADGPSTVEALLALHGALAPDRIVAIAAATRTAGEAGPARSADVAPRLADDVTAELEADVVSSVAAWHAREPLASGAPLAELRPALASRLRRSTGVPERIALALATTLLDGLVTGGRLARDGGRLRDPARSTARSPQLAAAMDRLERSLATVGPPPLSNAARDAGCPPEGIRALEAEGRIVRVDADLAWAAPTYHALAARAVAMARVEPLSPAAFRDATASSRRFVLALLEDLDRRGILARGPDGHRLGPRAPAPPTTPASATVPTPTR
jgi:selenocysteine-specific elongation factor